MRAAAAAKSLSFGRERERERERDEGLENEGISRGDQTRRRSDVRKEGGREQEPAEFRAAKVLAATADCWRNNT